MERQVVGLDVSKAWLDGYLASSGRRLRVSNDAAGIRALVRTLGDSAGCLVVMEASGGYERTAHRALLAQGVLAAIVNPSSASARSVCGAAGAKAPEGGSETSRAAWAWRPRPTGSTPR